MLILSLYVCIYYIVDGALSRFINYGYGALKTVEGIQTHRKFVLGVNLDACAQLCLAENCASFDFVFGLQSCQLSQYIAANVHGIRTDFKPGLQVMHYEAIGKHLQEFKINSGSHSINMCGWYILVNILLNVLQFSCLRLYTKRSSPLVFNLLHL